MREDRPQRHRPRNALMCCDREITYNASPSRMSPSRIKVAMRESGQGSEAARRVAKQTDEIESAVRRPTEALNLALARRASTGIFPLGTAAQQSTPDASG